MAALLGADLSALAVAGFGGLAAAAAVGQPPNIAALASLAALLTLMCIAFWLVDLYPGARLDGVAELRRMTLVVLGLGVPFNILMLMGLSWPEPLVGLLPVTIATGLLVVLAPVARAAVRQLCASKAWWGVPTVVLGGGAAMERLVAMLKRSPERGVRPVACFSQDACDLGRDVAGVVVVGRFSDAPRYRDFGVRHAVIVDRGTETTDLVAAATHSRAFPNTVVLPVLDGCATGGLSGALVCGGAAPGPTSGVGLRYQDAAKRALDLLLVVPASLVALPLVAICAIAVAAMSPGSPFYFQAREGRGGRTIKVWKLRTMYPSAEALLERYLNDNPTARTEWEQRYKLAQDPRILPGIGTFLRRTSLDELPQLWCILRGDMSFVGPRPFPSYHLAAFTEPFRHLRRSVPPGLTGLWQVSGRSEGGLGVQEELDTHYINHWSIWMDLYVLARTPIAVLLGRGAT